MLIVLTIFNAKFVVMNLKNILIKTFLFLFLATKIVSHDLIASESLTEEPIVILIHGFMGNARFMTPLEIALQEEKRNVINWEYHSQGDTIQNHGLNFVDDLKKIVAENPGTPIHFVTHSLGGLVLLSALQNEECPSEAKMGKAVLLAPPLHGSVWGRWLGKWQLARLYVGPFSGRELLDTEDFYEILGPFPHSMQIFIIAGSGGRNYFLYHFLQDGDPMTYHDGTLLVSETFLPPPCRHVIVPREHKLLVYCSQVARLVNDFLSEDSRTKSSGEF